MLFKVLHNSIRATSIPFLFGKHPDDIPVSQLNVDPNEFKEETGWDRVRQMYTINEFGETSPEVNTVLQVGMVSVLFGGMYGGYLHSRHAYQDFMINNTATSFKSHFEAKKKLQDHVTVNFGKGAFRWSWRLGLFSMSLMALTSTIQVYRNKYGITEYVIAGGVSGALYRFNMGPKGWVAGGVLGSCLGIVCGALTEGLLKLAGISMKEAHMWRNKLTESRLQMNRKAREQISDNEDYGIIKMHDNQVGDAGHSIEAINTAESVSKEKSEEVKPSGVIAQKKSKNNVNT